MRERAGFVLNASPASSVAPLHKCGRTCPVGYRRSLLRSSVVCRRRCCTCFTFLFAREGERMVGFGVRRVGRGLGRGEQVVQSFVLSLVRYLVSGMWCCD